MDQSLPDPGNPFSFGPAKWRILGGSDDLVSALRTFRFTSAKSHPGLHVLKSDNRLFWGRLQAGGTDYFIKGRREDRWRSIVKSLFRASEFGAEWQKTWWLKSKGMETA